MHRLSHSPPPTLSKRDKRRNAMIERLRDIEEKFASNKDFYYRQQLQALQRDASIITYAEPYRNQPLDELDELLDADENVHINGNRSNHHTGVMGNGERQPRAGKWARGFIERVNNAMEDRDIQLSLIVDRHNFRIRELKEDYEYAVTVADKEYTYLLNILRTRLVQTIEQKRAALLKERDKCELSDTTSLLLNPTHLGSTNPASPGGPQSNRKTRHGRHRYDADDTGENRRKRKLPADDEGSPGPSSRTIDAEAPVVVKESLPKAETPQSLSTPPSMGLLFSDKELIITNQEASYAALQDILAKRKKSTRVHAFDKEAVRKMEAMTSRVDRSLKPSKNGSRLSRLNESTNPTTANVSDDEDAPNDMPSQIDGADEALSDDIFLTAPAMDRTANSSVHATRSTRAINPLFPLSNSPLQALGPLAGRASAVKYMGSYNKERKLGSDEYQRAPPLSEQEVEDDLALIAAAVRDGEASPGKLNLKFLEDLGTEVVDYTNDGSGEGASARGSRESSATA
ncbi:MAG: hypothetical protein Q9213_003759 [Squamulea squamosa]